METLCCSNICEKRNECKKHCINNTGIHYVEDFYTFGSGSTSKNGYKDNYLCGKLGDYKMFEPIEKEEEKILFPFQYINKYLLGEMDWDSAFDSTMDEVYRLLDEYIDKHDLKN